MKAKELRQAEVGRRQQSVPAVAGAIRLVAELLALLPREVRE